MIPGVTDRPRLPRIAKIRLGKKVRGRGAPYPKATEQFNFVDCPEVEAVYGKDCKLLRVQFPTNDPNLFFPTRRAAFRKSGLFCACDDGVTAVRTNVGYCRNKDGTVKPDSDGQPVPLDGQGWAAMKADPEYWDEQKAEPSIGEGAMFEMPCPGDDCPMWEKGLCKRNARLFFVLKDVRQDGCYEIATTSFNSIRQILDVVGFVQLRNVSVAWLDFELRLVPMKGREGGTIYVLRLEHPGPLPSPRAALPEPVAVPEQPEEVPEDLVAEAGAELERELGGEVDQEINTAVDAMRLLAHRLGDALGMTTAVVELDTAKAEKEGHLGDLVDSWQVALEEREAEFGKAVASDVEGTPAAEPPDDSDETDEQLFGPPPAESATDQTTEIAAAALAGQKNAESKVGRPKHGERAGHRNRQREPGGGVKPKEPAGGGLLDF